MTATQSTVCFETNFVINNSDDSHLIMSENITDDCSDAVVSSPSSVTASMQESSDLNDSKHPEVSTITNEEKSTENQNITSNQDSNSETLPRAEEDEWLDIMGSGNFKKKVIKSGIGHETRPSRGDKVTVDISYYVNSQLIEEQKDLRFIVGDLDVIQGIDLAICLMEKGEQAKIMIPSKLAYGTIGLLPDVPPDSDIECDIELKEVEPVDELSLSISERLKLGDDKRSRGNFFYDRGQYIDAIHCYERSAEYLDGIRDCSDSSPGDLQEIVNMRLKVYNNMAASHLKMNAYSSALKSVESVLKVQPKNVKALFRKGKILGLQGQIDEAINCLKTAANLEPETKIILVELAKLKYQKKREEQTQKMMYQRMFKSEPKKPSKAVSWVHKWSMISCGVLAVAIGSAVAYRQYHP